MTNVHHLTFWIVSQDAFLKVLGEPRDWRDVFLSRPSLVTPEVVKVGDESLHRLPHHVDQGRPHLVKLKNL